MTTGTAISDGVFKLQVIGYLHSNKCYLTKNSLATGLMTTYKF